MEVEKKREQERKRVNPGKMVGSPLPHHGAPILLPPRHQLQCVVHPPKLILRNRLVMFLKDVFLGDFVASVSLQLPS